MLGLTVVKPDSFRFTRLDAVWPDYTIVAMEGPQRQTVDASVNVLSLLRGAFRFLLSARLPVIVIVLRPKPA